MSQTIHEQCLEKDRTPFSRWFVYWGSGVVKMTVQRRKETKDWKWRGGGGNGCEPPLSRALCNQRWEYYPHKSTVNLSSGPRGTGPSSYWPTSVLCLADGRRSCPNESSWSPRWNPCSRLGNTNNNIICYCLCVCLWNILYSTNTLMQFEVLAKGHLPHADKEHKCDLSKKKREQLWHFQNRFYSANRNICI